MQWFRDLKIARKLLIAFAVVQLMMLVLGIACLQSMSRINQASDDLAENWLPSVRAVMQVRADVGDLRRQELAFLMAEDPEERNRIVQQMETLMAASRTNLDNYAKLISSAEERALFDSFRGSWQSFLVEHGNLMALARAGNGDEARAVSNGPASRMLREINGTLEQLVRLNVEGGDRASAAATQLYENTRMWTIVLLAGAVTAGIALALWVAGIVAKPLREAVDVARTVAGGDLTRSIHVRSRDETGELMAALQDMTASLQSLVAQVRAGTETISTASGQIAAGNQDLSSRTEQQASSLEETASSMEELTSTVRQNADNARQANQLAQSASGIAVRGGQVVGEVVGTMASINAASQRIVEIIGTIDSIAFQTNILALNAAVEAARAGEQGRGFAVVATEVRNLAHRSAAAAKDIKQLIGDSVEKVDAGARLVDEAGNTMRDIVASIARVSDIVSEISAASNEQSAGIEQVNEAVVQMDQATQQNAALVEESAAAAEAMQRQATRLAELVATFRVNADAMAGVAAQAVVAPVRAAAARPALPRMGGKDEWETY
ncbi:methyl-accepting chemotaxis protein [Pseudoduganella umbonata]|uniref:HAMP domain-containing protein n=1 Tax=Pseudoduganella umbonata TaxID=864828 RepID=A0A4V1EDN4_9BURK|nr:methyl-accepting chemotaxis protein [Pseudoduganella umbonata]MBB3220847.1 methyl-accepting chemotaxis protein [Pseudoduganella umbonata]QCP11691.1 HAMP domain-containing protein [Pseudoduganella umbonata]